MSRPHANESTFRAIAHPTRRRILDLLRKDEATVGEIVGMLKISHRNLSPHLSVLRTSGLIVNRRRGTYRVYKIAPTGLAVVIGWLRPFESLARLKHT